MLLPVHAYFEYSVQLLSREFSYHQNGNDMIILSNMIFYLFVTEFRSHNDGNSNDNFDKMRQFLSSVSFAQLFIFFYFVSLGSYSLALKE